MEQKKAVTLEFARNYRKADKAEKTKILNGFITATGYHRKYAITILNREGKTKILYVEGNPTRFSASHKSGTKRVYNRVYDEAVRISVVLIWQFFNYMCGKRLVPLIRDTIEALHASGLFNMNNVVTEKLMRISVATVERMLTVERKKWKLKGRSTTKAGTLLRNQIPVRVFFDWDERLPGFCEMDTVSHDGGNAAGEYAFTLTVTDVCSGWTELRALKNKAHRWVYEAMIDIKDALPVTLKGVDSDNGGEFINKPMQNWCEKEHITFTRARSYHKNDNCFVEQKNGDLVRKTVGYSRFEGDDVLEALKAVYEAFNPLQNYFYPSAKIIEKQRLGAKTHKRYDLPKPPYVRLLERDDVSDEIKRRLISRKNSLNVVAQKIELTAAVDTLMRIVHNKNRS